MSEHAELAKTVRENPLTSTIVFVLIGISSALIVAIPAGAISLGIALILGDWKTSLGVAITVFASSFVLVAALYFNNVYRKLRDAFRRERAESKID